MSWTLVAAAAGAGLAGSLHCAAMCGPLATAAAAGKPVRGGLEYAGGRLLGYAAVGALFGMIGEHTLCHVPMAGIGSVAGWLVVAFALAQAFAGFPRKPALTRLGKKRVPIAARLFARVPRRPVAFGLVTAILPCGMLLPAWALAALGGSALAGAGIMAVFALASLPGLISPVFLAPLARRLVAHRPWVTSLFWGALAIWLALRQLPGAAHHH